MKREDYRPLGEYIQIVDERNRDGIINNLVGVSFEKKIIPSIANTIGTDLSNYRIIKPGQFAYCPVTSRNGDRISIALYKGNNKAILSVAYTVFEITKPQDLDSDYLMLWVSRPEFDRYARFMSHGSVRELFSWEEMCNVMLPVPSIEEQRRIVAEYQTVERRIKNNEALIQKLEETAQAIYHHTFVEGIDENNLPKGWRNGCIRDLSKEIVCGKTPSTDIEEYWGDYMPFLTIPDMHDKVYAMTTERSLSKEGVETQSNKTLPINSICVSCIGTAGLVCITTSLCQTNQQINTIIPKDGFLYYSYFVCSSLRTIIKEYGAGGAVLSNLSKSQFEDLKIHLPEVALVGNFNTKVGPIFELIKSYQLELTHLRKFQSLLTSKLA